MNAIREIWVEFGDGSVAKYGVKEEDVPSLLNQLLNVGVSCTIWIDGRIWKQNFGPEGAEAAPNHES